MPSPERIAAILLLLAAALEPVAAQNPHAGGAPPIGVQAPTYAPPTQLEQTGDAVPAAPQQQALLKRTLDYFRLKDGGDYQAAYAFLAPAMQSYLKPDLYRSTAERFNIEAGAVEERRIVRMTWERDPPGAAEPGLYVAADFFARFPDVELMCGYVMWRQQKDGSFRIVREEQSLIDTATARRMVPERRRELPKLFGCVGA